MAKKAIFLDRDDTLIQDPGYISSPDQVKLLGGVAAALKQLSDIGFKLIIVTNQSGIARGLFDEYTLEQIHKRLKNLLIKEAVVIDNIYYCPYHIEATVERFKKDSPLRKPAPGMLLKAAEEMNIDLKQSWMIGNSDRDVKAGKSAGCKTILIVPSHKQGQIKYRPDEANYVVTNIKEAANIIKRHSSKSAPKTQSKDNSNSAVTDNIKTQHSPDTVITTGKETTKTQAKPLTAQQQEKETISHTQDKTLQKNKNDKPKSPVSTAEENYLQQIYNLLKAHQRDRMFSDFTGLMLIAYALQVVVGFLVIAAIFFVIKSNSNSYLCLTFAMVLQLMALTLFIIKQNK